MEGRILSLINEADDFMSARSLNSPRAVGDALETLISENIELVVGSDQCKDCSASFARRAMADVAFTDADDNYYVVDVKTHRTSTKFNMPNLTSVERLSRFYDEDANYFSLLMISYDIVGSSVRASSAHFVPIEYLSWDCLTIGALGWGQIQIANSNNVIVNDGITRKDWMIQLCDTLLEFYPREISKIGDRITRFEAIREKWLMR